ncbi:carbohydrate-binding protein [Puniceicoccaceae bacterium K14]|nr:carbohydrate-binding protein [Puniceicoccaceae bacterium K14]
MNFEKKMIKYFACIVFLLTAGCDGEAPSVFYVAPDGSDSNLGTKESPFKTLAHARDAVRLINDEMDEDIYVYLRGGNYPVDEIVEFGVEDSGTNGHWGHYQAYEDEVPVFNGGEKVSDWKMGKGGIYEASLDHDAKLRSLFVDGERAYMASTTANAKSGWGSFEVKKGQADWAWVSGSTVDGVTFEKSEMAELSNAEDVEIWRNTKWNSHILGIREIATEGGDWIYKFQQPYAGIAMNIKYGAYHPSRGHAIVNAFELLDEPGEFYYDRKGKIVYYLPREGEDMASADVYAPVVGQLLSIQGESRENRVRNLSFEGITFAYTESELPEVAGSVGKSTVQAATWVVAFDEPDWHPTQYRTYDTMPNAITVSSAESIRFEDNVLAHIGNEGIGFINDVVDLKFVGNFCDDIGGSAIQVGHPQHVYVGDEHEYARYSSDVEGVCKDILVENNVLYDMTNMFYGHAPITAYFADGLKIRKNHIQECNYTAVSLGWAWNNFDEISTDGNPTTVCRNNEFNYNRVYNCMEMLHDGGAFYTLGSQPNSEASGNYVKAPTTHFQGVYHPDEGTAWYTGKDLVFEITPSQDNFELNKWRRKHDNHYSNIYTTSESNKLGAPNCTLTDLHVFPDANWPEEALAIIRAAGPDAEYDHLLEQIPGIIFEEGKRYDTDEVIVSADVSTTNSPPTEGVRYEAEDAVLSGDAVVESHHIGFSGKGFVEGFYESSDAGVTFTVEAAELGTYTAILRYAAGVGESTNMALYVNGKKSSSLKCEDTGGWKSWSNHVESVFLEAGVNTISVRTDGESASPINLDYIQLTN